MRHYCLMVGDWSPDPSTDYGQIYGLSKRTRAPDGFCNCKVASLGEVVFHVRGRHILAQGARHARLVATPSRIEDCTSDVVADGSHDTVVGEARQLVRELEVDAVEALRPRGRAEQDVSQQHSPALMVLRDPLVAICDVCVSPDHLQARRNAQ